METEISISFDGHAELLAVIADHEVGEGGVASMFSKFRAERLAVLRKMERAQIAEILAMVPTSHRDAGLQIKVALAVLELDFGQSPTECAAALGCLRTSAGFLINGPH